MGVLRTKNPKNGPKHGHLCTFRVFGPNLLWASDWHENSFTWVLRSTQSTRLVLNLDSERFSIEIRAFLEFLVPIYYGRSIDMKMHSHNSLGQHDHNDTTCTQFGLRAFRHENPCISRVSARFFSEHLIDPKIILNESLGQHDQNDVSYTQIGPQTRKLSLIEVLTFWVCVSLNVHAYIGLYLTHACQKCFWKSRKISFSAHARSTMYGQKR